MIGADLTTPFPAQMRRLLSRTILAIIAAATPAIGRTADAQWPPAGVSYFGDTGVPDISGLWLGSASGVPGKGASTNSGSTSDGRPPTYLAPWPLPYTPAYRKIADDRAAATKRGTALGDIGARCLPQGLPYLLVAKNYPDEIVQTPGQVTIFMYNMFPVVIWTDGRPHPQGLASSYNGHSIGHWVGDRLFVDTVGINAATPLDGERDPHSGQLHLKWTMQRVAADTLHVHIVLTDPDAFTEPVATTNIWQRKSDLKWQVLDDASCFENASGITAKPIEDGFIKF